MPADCIRAERYPEIFSAATRMTVSQAVDLASRLCDRSSAPWNQRFRCRKTLPRISSIQQFESLANGGSSAG